MGVAVEVVVVIRSRVAQGRCGFVVGERVGEGDGLGSSQGLQSTTSGFIRQQSRVLKGRGRVHFEMLSVGFVYVAQPGRDGGRVHGGQTGDAPD